MRTHEVDVVIHANGKVDVAPPTPPSPKPVVKIEDYIVRILYGFTILILIACGYFGLFYPKMDVVRVEASPTIQYVQMPEPMLAPPLPLESETDGFKPIDIPLSEDDQRYIYNLCEEYDVDYAIFLGQIWTESRFNNDAVSVTGDHGLVQLNASQLGWLSDRVGCSESELKSDMRLNIRGSLECWKYFKEKFPGLSDGAYLMCYNQGETSAHESLARGITSEYAKTVMAQASIYSEMLNS